MRAISFHAVVILVSLLLSACALSFGTRVWFTPGSSTQSEVRSRLGAPSGIWHGKDGTEHWDYSGNPYSFQAYRASFDERGVLTQFRSLRDFDDLRLIVPGKSTSEHVKEVFGEPVRVYFIRGEPHWEWPILRPIREPHRLVVHFTTGGVVKSMGAYRIETGGPRLMIGM